MTVSRKGKRGTRVGTMRPQSRNRRVQRNARLKRITQNDATTPKRTMTREEWVIRTVTNIVGSKAGSGFVKADDMVSDIILELLDAGGFLWPEDDIKHFCFNRTKYMISKYLRKKEKSECEFIADGSEQFSIVDISQSTPAMQDICVDAGNAYRRLQRIPNIQRQALEVLCDGGNPIDVADELGVTPWAAVALIKEGREYVSRVDE